MRSLGKSLLWRIGYGVCCLVYVVWMVNLSLNNFGMVHSDYRLAGERLQPVRVKEIALQELFDQCRKGLKSSDWLQSAGDSVSGTAENACLSWPAAVLDDRQKVVEERLVNEKSGVFRKLLLCYVVFGVVFLILPPVILYLLLSFFVWIFKSTTVAE